ncbi:MAG: hypothetical protein GEV10_17920 [Streptosporangiales bacterium]|nr:hypothetical protein [Streptosporangiales bacterium]
MKYGLEFLDLPRRGRKPRDKGITIVRDWGFGVGEATDVARAIGDYLDYVKLRQWAVWYTAADITREKNAIYRRHDIVPFPGGIVFEVAYHRGMLPQTLDGLRDLGFQAIEISDNIIDIALADKRQAVEGAIAAGLEVLFEYGKKYPTAAFDVDGAADEINAMLDAGASRVILERSQLDVTLGARCDGKEAGRLVRLVEKTGLDPLIFEAETTAHQMWLLETFGPDVNLGPNILPEQVGLKIEPARYGIGRDEGYTLFQQLEPATDRG